MYFPFLVSFIYHVRGWTYWILFSSMDRYKYFLTTYTFETHSITYYEKKTDLFYIIYRYSFDYNRKHKLGKREQQWIIFRLSISFLLLMDDFFRKTSHFYAPFFINPHKIWTSHTIYRNCPCTKYNYTGSCSEVDHQWCRSKILKKCIEWWNLKNIKWLFFAKIHSHKKYIFSEWSH